MPAIFPTRPKLPGNGLLQESVDASTTPPVLSAIYGESDIGGADAVAGVNFSTGAGVSGSSQGGIAVYGESAQNEGVRGVSHSNAHAGVTGFNDGGQIAVYGESTQNEGVRGVSHSNAHAGVTGFNQSNGPGIYGTGGGAPFSGDQFPGAALFDGDVKINGKLFATVDVLVGADCAEEFDSGAEHELEPGTVLVLNQDGMLQPGDRAYDRKVAGVISGAGDYRPGLILDRRESARRRTLVALLGKVYCKVDARYSAIEVGDLLTTSPTLGHAMKAEDPARAFGAVIGKALRPLEDGQGLIPILISLQ
jgi:hypothetical protein